jgi:hypothetical protein
MSAQLPDRMVFQGKEYDVITSFPPKLFNPISWGLKPASPHGACLRGTLLTYEVKEETLYLKDLRYWTKQANLSDLVPGVPMKEDETGGCIGYLYSNINAVIPWSGEIVIGRSFLWPLLLPRGFQPAWKYKEVTRLLFEEGSLRAYGDVSRSMARLRSEVLHTVH